MRALPVRGRADAVSQWVVVDDMTEGLAGSHAPLAELITRYERFGAIREAARSRHLLRAAGGTSRSPRGRRG